MLEEVDVMDVEYGNRGKVWCRSYVMMREVMEEGVEPYYGGAVQR